MLWLLLSACLVTDDDLDARTDADGDGYVSAALGGDDCDDADRHVNPGAREVCNGVDDDCDGHVDDGEDATTWYADADADGHGDPDAPTRACEPPDGHVASSDDCDDTRDDVHPGADEIGGDWVGNRCQGAEILYDDDAGYRIDPQVRPTGPDPFHDGVHLRKFGAAVHDVGDVTGDGHADLYVGAHGDARSGSTGVENGGGFAIFDGPIDGDRHFGTAHAVRVGHLEHMFVGTSAAGGDLTGDGIAELLVTISGVPAADNDNRVYVWPGPISMGSDTLDGVRTLVPRTSIAGVQHGNTLGIAPDGGQGPALVIGQLGGREVHLFHGLPADTAKIQDAPVRFIDTSVTGRTLSAGLDARGDADGDGISELALGATTHRDLAGAVYVFSGPFDADRHTDSADATFRGEPRDNEPNWRVGKHLAWSDLDGDGRDDLLVGALGAERAWVILDPLGRDGAIHDLADVRFTGSVGIPGEGVVAAPGDLDGDGHADVAVANPHASDEDGAVYVFRGPLSSGAFEGADAVRLGSRDGGALGIRLTTLREPDGRRTLVAGAPYHGDGVVHLFPPAR